VARRAPTVPRKRPQQERSRDTVEVILTAAERVLAQGGLATLTTARVAEVAGISVGSLYQYFPNKEAICGALLERSTARYREAFRLHLASTRTLPLEVALRRTIEGILQVFRAAPRFQSELFETVSDSGRRDMYRAYLEACTEIFTAYLASRADDVRGPVEIAAYVVVRAADGLAQAIARDQPDDARAAALVAEMSDLAIGYLRRAP
jgi:AcrR family transcriptional regulator